MGWKESKQAFQYALPYEQVFQAAMAAVPMVPKAVLTSADVNARFITFDTPTSFTSYGENIVVGFIPSETGVIVEVTCATKGMPTSCRTAVTARRSSSTSRAVRHPPGQRYGGHPLLTHAMQRGAAVPARPWSPGLDYEAGEPSSAHCDRSTRHGGVSAAEPSAG